MELAMSDQPSILDPEKVKQWLKDREVKVFVNFTVYRVRENLLDWRKANDLLL